MYVFLFLLNDKIQVDKIFHRAYQFARIEGNFRTPNPNKVVFDKLTEKESIFNSRYNFTGSSMLVFEADNVYECLRDGRLCL